MDVLDHALEDQQVGTALAKSPHSSSVARPRPQRMDASNLQEKLPDVWIHSKTPYFVTSRGETWETWGRNMETWGQTERFHENYPTFPKSNAACDGALGCGAGALPGRHRSPLGNVLAARLAVEH